MEQSDCLNCFLTKTEVVMHWKRWSKKIDNIVWAMQGQPLPNTSNNSTCVVIFFHQRFQSTKTPVFVRKLSSNRLFSYFLAKIWSSTYLYCYSHHWRV